MNKDILTEINFFLSLFCVGAFLFIVYDVLRIIRHIIKHPRWIIAFEDVIFWVCASFYVFSIIYQKNHGTIRWYSILSLGLGIFTYHKLFSDQVVRFFVKIIKKILYLLKKVLMIFLRPFRYIVNIIKKLILKIAAICKKRTKKIYLFLQNRLKIRKEKIKIKREEKKAKKVMKKKLKESELESKSKSKSEPEAVTKNKSPKGSFELIRQPEEEKGEPDETHKKKKKRT